MTPPGLPRGEEIERTNEYKLTNIASEAPPLEGLGR